MVICTKWRRRKPRFWRPFAVSGRSGGSLLLVWGGFWTPFCRFGRAFVRYFAAFKRCCCWHYENFPHFFAQFCPSCTAKHVLSSSTTQNFWDFLAQPDLISFEPSGTCEDTTSTSWKFHCTSRRGLQGNSPLAMELRPPKAPALQRKFPGGPPKTPTFTAPKP